MVDINELDVIRDNIESKGFKVATVSSLSVNGTANVTFYGENAESQKGFCYLSSYEPSVDDTVIMLPIADTYIILGKIKLSSDTPTNFITSQEINSVLNDFITSTELTQALSEYAKTSALSGYSTTSHSHTTIYSTPSYGVSAGLAYVYNGTVCLAPDSSLYLGNSSHKWKQLFADTTTISTSDLRKKTIVDDIENYEGLFKGLKPIVYAMNNEESQEKHIGFGVQDILATLVENGMTARDLAAASISPIFDSEGKLIDCDYGLGYSEFIALNTHMIQKLMSRVDELETKVKAFEGGIS